MVRSAGEVNNAKQFSRLIHPSPSPSWLHVHAVALIRSAAPREGRQSRGEGAGTAGCRCASKPVVAQEGSDVVQQLLLLGIVQQTGTTELSLHQLHLEGQTGRTGNRRSQHETIAAGRDGERCRQCRLQQHGSGGWWVT